MAVVLVALTVAAVYFAVRWFFSWVSVMTLLWFLSEHGHDKPTDEDIHAGTRWVFAHFTELVRKKSKP